MALFRNRPLATAAIAMLFAVALFYFLPMAWGIALLATLFVAGISVLLFGRRDFGGKVLTLFLVCLFAFLGTGRALLDRALADRAFGDTYGTAVEAVVEVEEFAYRNEFSTETYVRVVTLDGKRCTQRAVLRTEGIFPFYIGDRITATFVFREPSYQAYSKESERTYLGNAARAVLIPQSEMLLCENGKGSFSSVRADLAASLSFRIRKALPGKGGELLSAMLIGDRNNLADEVVRDFRRIGISHLLAISGLHLSVLCMGCDRLLRVCRVHKKWRLAATLLLSVLYFILTGGSISILRAAFMFGFLQASFLLRTDNDALTSLSLSAAILVFLTPTVIFNVSFLMTVLATFGILSFADIQKLVNKYLPRADGVWRIPRKALSFVLSSLLLSTAASLALLPVQLLIFGELSLLTPLSNLIFVPLALPLLVFALLALTLSGIPFLWTILSAPIGGILKAVLWLSGKLSAWRCLVSLHPNFVPYIFIPLLVATLLLLCVDLKRRKPLVLAPCLAATLAFSLCLGITYHNGKDFVDAVYQRSGENEAILLYQSGKGVIFDLSGNGYSQLYTHYLTLTECGATEIEALVYTHYHDAIPTALSKLAKRCLVRRIYLPFPTHEREIAPFEDLLRVAEEHGVHAVVYERGESVSLCGEIGFSTSDMIYSTRSVEPAFSLNTYFSGSEILYESSAWNEYNPLSADAVKDAEYLILGAHGPKPQQAVSVTRHPIPSVC